MTLEEVKRYFLNEGKIISKKHFEKENGLYRQCLDNILTKNVVPRPSTLQRIVLGIYKLSKNIEK